MMNRCIQLLLCFVLLPLYAADNEIYVDQSGTGANIDLEQLGISNIIGGLNSTAGSVNAFDLDGTTMTLDINMIGATNKFLGDIFADNFTGLYNFTGGTNTFTIQVDPTDSYSSDGSNQNVAVTGSSNTFTLNQGTTAIAASLDLDWIIQGSNNTITSNINIDGATNYMDIDGSDNTVNYTGTGVNASAGGYFYLDHTGGSRTFNIQQLSTQDNDWLKIISNGGTAASTVCVIQNDQGTSTSC
ncbi:MAG: hypothetical protein CBC57_01845 [Euryarchaeota archaeon TMED97]|nr:MAG: hypothetical protein CBC57_01845 [Euryarchaeota archaeon TMED97]